MSLLRITPLAAVIATSLTPVAFSAPAPAQSGAVMPRTHLERVRCWDGFIASINVIDGKTATPAQKAIACKGHDQSRPPKP